MEDEWQLINAYRRLMVTGKVKDFTCSYCNLNAVVMMGKDGRPIVKCFTCGSAVYPNGRFYDEIRRRINR